MQHLKKHSAFSKVLAALIVFIMVLSFGVVANAAADDWVDIDGYTPAAGLAIQTSKDYPMNLSDGVFSTSNKGVANSISGIKISASNAGLLSFKAKISGEQNYDVLYYSINTELSNGNYSSADNYNDRSSYSGDMNWNDFSISVSEGDTVYLVYRKDSSTNRFDDTVLIKDIVLEGYSYYDVTAHSNNNSWGTVSAEGTGTHLLKGTTIRLTAATNSNIYTFIGWFDGDTLLSTNKSYTFNAAKDIDVEARFAEKISGLTLTCHYDHDKVRLEYRIERDDVWYGGRQSVPADGVIRDLLTEDLIHTYATVIDHEYMFDGWYTDDQLNDKATEADYDSVYVRLAVDNVERWMKISDNPLIDLEGFVPVEGISSVKTRTTSGINGCYPWTIDENGWLVSTNTVDNTVSSVGITVSQSGILSFEFKAQGNDYYDWITASKEEEITPKSKYGDIIDDSDGDGNVNWTEKTVPMNAGDTLWIGYSKQDKHEGEPTGWLRNFSFQTGTVTVQCNSADISMGTVNVTGVGSGGAVALGSEVTLSATPTQNVYTFDGWYLEDGTKLSGSANYKFNVTSDLNITGRFAYFAFDNIKGYTPGDGIASVQTRNQYGNTYSWIIDGEGNLVSSNTGIDYSVASMKITAAESGNLCLEYTISSEASYDWLGYKIGEELLTSNITNASNASQKSYFSGNVDWKVLMLDVNAGDELYISFYKDVSTGSGADRVMIRDIGIYSGEKTITAASNNESRGTVSIEGTDEYNHANVGDTVTVTATIGDGMVLVGWYDENGRLRSSSPTYTFTVLKNIALTAKFYEQVDNPAAMIRNVGFASIDSAFADAVSGDIVAVVKNLTLTNDLTIPSGVTLLIPYAANATTINAASENHPYANSTTNGAVTTVSGPADNLYLTLTVGEGVSINVSNNAKLVLGGLYSGYQPNGGGTYGAHSNIELRSGATINVSGSGIFSTYGYVTGSGKVNVSNGGSLYEPFIVTDFHGGTYTANAYSNFGVTPFESYAMQNVQTEMTVDSDSNVYGYCALYAMGSHNETTVKMIGKNNAMFLLTDGSTLTTTYDANKAYTAGGCNFGRKTLTVTGECEVGTMRMTLLSIVEIDTSPVVFPVPCNLSLVVTDGSILSVPTKTALLPGTEVIIQDGAFAAISGELYVFDGMAARVYSASNAYGTHLDTSKYSDRAHLIVDGEVEVYKDALFAGIVETNGTGCFHAEDGAILSGKVYDGVIKGGVVMGNDTTMTNRTGYPITARLFDLETEDLVDVEPEKYYYGDSYGEKTLNEFDYTVFSGDADNYTEDSATGTLSNATIRGSWFTEDTEYSITYNVTKITSEGVKSTYEVSQQTSESRTVIHNFAEDDETEGFSFKITDAKIDLGIGAVQPFNGTSLTVNGIKGNVTVNVTLTEAVDTAMAFIGNMEYQYGACAAVWDGSSWVKISNAWTHVAGMKVYDQYADKYEVPNGSVLLVNETNEAKTATLTLVGNEIGWASMNFFNGVTRLDDGTVTVPAHSRLMIISIVEGEPPANVAEEVQLGTINVAFTDAE